MVHFEERTLMGKTIIAVRGASNSGKTATIKEFRNVLINAYPNHKETLFINNNEIKTIIEIIFQNRQLKIGIESQGDPDSRLIDEKLEDFISTNCDIIICACRTKGETIAVVYDVANANNYNLIFASTYVSNSQHNILNPLMAEHLLKLVEAIA